MDEKNIDQIISDYLSNDIHLNEKNIKASKLALLDTLGCVFNASLNTSATIFATYGLKDTLDNPIAYMKDIKSLKEKARFFSVLTRWFDYNDTFLAKEWAHPSDNIGTIFSYFIENNNFKVSTFIDSLIKMYEIQGCLALGTSLNKKGYDHVFYVKLASASVFSSLISNNDSEIIKRTVNNILLDGLNLRAYRHEPNVGKRKSWAAGDAVSRGIELASISEFEDEIYSEIQKDENWGFEKVLLNGENLSFGKDLNDWVIENVLFKVLYPAEFHGQSAIEASVKLSDLYKEREQEIEGIIIETHEPAIRIISNKDKLKNASDRDHSLEFMVAAGLLFKEVNSKTYEDNFSGLKQIENLRRKIKVQENKEFTENYYDISKRHIANTVYFEYNDGSFSKKETVETPIGHPNRREEAEPLLKQKFINNMSSHFSEERAKDIWEKILLIDVDSEFKEVIKLLSND